ncbi:SipW-dependent-type signal peptide-containing protein [Cryobacterium sp. PH31-L1]|uniref:SipW-dependent-type signal peptide-containing protein n=1 Tax=Cryobacterium sp. PH31-L1 TaxID=3046199 RepID=UPI0024B89A2E|nr:SipW-dependent-type signal peptide-containing protein [Cryobacterium sp. PH31-L1]MDJ0376920.1 SipW-dependent-type signal peptide-containing protein [Cryobacterium sp. PH31-L1]
MSTSSNNSPGLTGRKVKAVLAGGLVLGIGAAVVLAAWNDSEFATSPFTTGTFELLGSVDGATFSIHDDQTPATLAFSTPVSEMSPGDVLAAPFVLHLSAATTQDGSLTVASAVGSGTAESELTYGLIAVASVAACTPTAVGTEIVAAGTALDAVGTPVTASLARSVDGVVPGADVFTCLQVTASPTLGQGTAAVGTWQFEAVSVP